MPLQPLENEESVDSQPPIFRLPSTVEDILKNDPAKINAEEGTSFISTDFDSGDILEDKPPPSPKATPNATCPMCGEVVDAEFLKTYNDGKQMNVRTQAKFCGAHKKRSARDDWKSSGYPTIDWESLEVRIAKHHSYLKGLLDGASSYCREILEVHIKSGKNRTLKQAVTDSDLLLTPGYYGSRGMRAMSENIMYYFSPQLRRAAVNDRVVSARGVTGYVQAVLVPELATRLIMEDMNIGAEEARKVMRESSSLGDMLIEEVMDVVSWREGDPVDD